MVKDHENRDYFLIEIGNPENLESVLNIHPEWKFEHKVDGLEKFNVFSLPRNHKDLDFFSNLNDLNDLDDLSSKKKLFKRDQISFIDNLLDLNINGLHLLPKKRLFKKTYIPINESEDADYSDFVNTNHITKRKNDLLVDQQSSIIEEFGLNDPLFKEQWHIFNIEYPGHDVNVIPVWRMNITGKGVVTALIDDGLDYESLDLKDNFSLEGSWDYNDNRQNPKPMLSNDYHGTRCAGEIAAAKGNNYCGVGVAYDSKVSGIRILSAEITSEEEAQAMMYGLNVNDIYSCSWGPSDNGKSMDAPDKIVKAAMLKGIQDGRNGKGALYVFASGNGAHREDSCNFDGYTNSIYSLTVSAIDYKGLHPPYSESCSAVLVSTYSSGSGEHIHTTDINDQCTISHGGTSAAAPLAAGIYSLILEANPDLTWRDVQYLTVLSANEINPFDSSWQDSAIENRKYSPKFGWGKIDAEKMVNMAKNDWKLLKPQSWYYSPYLKVNKKIINEINEIEDVFEINDKVIKKSNFEKIEQITVTVDIKSGKRGDVEVDLISPNGIKSQLAYSRKKDNDKFGFRKWTFSTVAHWNENLNGNWTLKVRNVGESNTVTFQGWQLRAFGECINPDLAKRFDMDEDYSVVNNEDDGEDDDKDNDNNSNTENNTVIETSTINTDSDNKENEISKTIVPLSPIENIKPSAAPDPTETDNYQPSITSETANIIPSSITSYTPDEGANKDRNYSTHYVGYFSLLTIIGFFLLMYIWKKRYRPGRARRREDFEFDIIRPDDEESSRFEFDDDNEEFEFTDDEEEGEGEGEGGDININTGNNTNTNTKNKNKNENTSNKLYTQQQNSSEFDLGNSTLSGYDQSDKIIESAINIDNQPVHILDEDYDYGDEYDEFGEEQKSNSTSNPSENDKLVT